MLDDFQSRSFISAEQWRRKTLLSDGETAAADGDD